MPENPSVQPIVLLPKKPPGTGRGTHFLWLARRFVACAFLAAVATGAAAVLLGDRVSHERTSQVALAKARFIADAILRPDLRGTDLRSGVAFAREAQLDALFRKQVLVDGVRRASIISAAGRITFSTDAPLIGTLSRISAAGVPRRPEPRPLHGVIRTIVPLAPVSGQRGGWLEVLQKQPSGGGLGRSAFLPLAGIIALTLIVLYVAIAPELRRMSGRNRQELRRMEQIEHQAFHDTLTGLPNRALFHDRVQQALRQAKRDQQVVAVMLMDLDRFKEINDTFGHHAGDQLLEEVGTHVCQAVRTADTVARLGGDEFAILTPAVAGPAAAMALAHRILEEVRRAHHVAGVEVDVDASIGIALCPHHGEDVDALLRCADVAMYVSKVAGAPTLYAVEHDHHSAERLALGTQLRRAIVQRELIVHYQPKAHLDSGEITSVEALVRWDHAERGMISPEQFIPLAEQTGLIRPLTSYVLDTALEQCRQWYDEGLEIAVAVNITGRDLLDQRFAEEVKDLLRKWAVVPSCLELEITETTVLTDPLRASAVLLTLSELGVRLAIDDFGSGNSSLGYLKRLPINVLKIDKSFVLQMHRSSEDAAIVRSTIELGHNLGLQVVAEGVSSLTAWRRLHSLGCDIAQGYYLSRPVPGEEIPKLLSQAKAA